ncbi:EAL domain-containing protein [Allobacillus sp. GCM10007491]|uniref:EAL domain-containing protein n=1 Tax=Allobacillus saliphilus TaxID=2912308 RepID=A0A941CV55_9BACI|nr:EAL domain-containing protein [Allobacillus saliphilus]MBR7553686.1 EAL domain-containing protein [Allobacillus saliphilus]
MVHQQVKNRLKVSPEEFLEGYRYIEEAMNQSDSYEDALQHILKYFDRKLTGTYSAIMIVDEKKEFIQECISNGLSEEFKKAFCGMLIDEGIVSNATSIRTGSVTYTENISNDLRGDVFSDLPDLLKLSSCRSIPIFDYRDNEVLAVFTIFSKQSHSPTNREVEIVKSFRSLLTLLITNYIQSELMRVDFPWMNKIKEPKSQAEEEFKCELLKAIENKEIKPFYQPLYQMDTNRIYGFEALARWDHPQKGILPPSEFIEYAEDHHIIDLIDDLVVEQACEDIQQLKEKYNQDFILSVNISALHITQLNFSTKLKNILLKTNFSGEQLALEITETALMQQIGYVSKTIDQIKQLGVQISIDDFGTSYSSLNYLKYLSVDMIKLDRSFVRDVVDNPVDQRICKTIIQLAEDLNLELLAEGIETKEHYEIIRNYGCKIFQGFYFSHPVKLDEVKQQIIKQLA